MPNTYHIQIFIEEARTPLNNGGKSLAGHMWFRISVLDEYNNIIKNSIVDAGYATNGIVNDDEETYLGKPTCESQKLEITQEIYERLKKFANREEGYAQSLGFGINDYNVLRNSCVDYVWKALEIAGYNEKQFEGKLVPMKNCQKIQAITSNTKSTIFNRNDLFYHFDTILYPSSFYFDFNTSKDNENGVQINPYSSYLPQESFLPPNTINSHRVGTIHFSIQALDEYTRMPIPNAKLQLQNINVGVESITNTQGIASFEIDSKENLKPFRAKLIHEDYQEYPILDRSIILNSIKRREKPLELRFRGKLWLLFNGESLSIMAGKDKILKTYTAYSGKALSPQEAQNLQQEYNYTSFVTYTNKGLFSDEILHFCLDTEWQKEKDKGAIPEGIYYIDINALQDSWSVFSENKFGKNTRIYTDKNCTNTRESATQRGNFYLHGGDKYGNAGGIDLAKEDTSFFNYLATLKAMHIYDSIYVEREKKCIIKLVVEYESLEILIEKLRIELNYLTESVYAMFAKEFIRIPQLRTEYQTTIRQISNEILTIVDKEQDKAKKYMLAKQYAKESYLLRNQVLNDIRNKSSEFAKALAKSEKPVLPSFESLIARKMQQNNFSGKFENLSLEQKIKVYRDIIDSSKSTRKSVNDKMPYYRFFGYTFIAITMAYVGYDLYYSDDKLKAAVRHTNTIGFGLLGGSVGMVMAVDTCDINPICYAGFALLGSLIGYSVGNFVNDATDFILKKYGYE